MKNLVSLIVGIIIFGGSGFVVSERAQPSMYPQCMKRCVDNWGDCNSHCNVDNTLSTTGEQVMTKANVQAGCSSSCMMNLSICQNGCSPYQGSTW